MRKTQVLLLLLTLVALCGAPSLYATPIVIDFGTGLAGAGGAISLAGGQASGSGILIGSLTVTGAPANNGVYVVDGTGFGLKGATAVMDFNTAAGNNFIRITGNIPGLGINNNIVLLNGVFSSFSIMGGGFMTAVVGQGPDTKGAALLSALQVPANIQFKFFGFTISAKLTGNGYTAYSTDIQNTGDPVPEPGAVFVLGMGVLGLAGVLALKQRAAVQK